MQAMQTRWSREAIETGSSFVLTICSCRRHGFGGADKVLCGLGIEKVQVLEVVVLRTLEHVEGHSERFAILVYGVEEVEEDLEDLESVILNRQIQQGFALTCNHR
jgi:hypothetical protein